MIAELLFEFLVVQLISWQMIYVDSLKEVKSIVKIK